METYELGLIRIGKVNKSKKMALIIKNDKGGESTKDENSKFKLYITRQFIKFIKNANVKANEKDCKQSGFSQFKSKDKLKRESKEVGQNNNIPTSPKCYGCQGYRHMKQECPAYLKSIGESEALATTLSDTVPEANSEDSDQEGIVSTFIATIDSFKESKELVDEEENFEKNEMLYRLDTRKPSEVELEREELSTKVDEANQTIKALWFENNFQVEKTEKLDTELFQVRAKLERTSSSKLDEMLNF